MKDAGRGDAPARAVVIGSSGGIGRALADALQRSGFGVDRLSRAEPQAGLVIDIMDEGSIAAAASALLHKAPYQIVLVAERPSAGRRSAAGEVAT